MDTYTARIATAEEKKIKQKARRSALLVLLLLLLLLLMPFVSGGLQTEKKYETVIMVDFEEEFTKTEASSARSSSKAARASKEKKNEEAPPPEEPVEKPVEEVKPEPKPKPKTKPTPAPITVPTKRKPLLTSTSPEVNISSRLKDIKVSENAQVEAVSDEVVEVTEEIDDDFMKEITDYFKKNSKKSKTTGTGNTPDATGSSSSSNADGSGSSATAGEGTSGNSDTGDAKTDGQGDAGNAGAGTFDGDGLLTRKVIRRANVESLIKSDGRIVINLCVNRDGKVIYSKADKKKSTISSRSTLKKAEITAAKYRYEKDYSVAERQCGKLSFVVKIER